MKNQKFSDQLSSWIKSDQANTIANLENEFQERSFAILFLILMILPATPLPTGAISHVFEIIVMLLSIQMFALGRKSLWLPYKWKNKELGLVDKALPTTIKYLKKAEKISKPRLAFLYNNSIFIRLTGLLIFIFTLAAFLAVPFSGLDTLPSLGVVLIALSMLFEDIALFILGNILGCVGIALELTAGAVTLHIFNKLF